MLCTLLVLNFIALLLVKHNAWRVILATPLNLWIVVLLNLGVVFLQNTNPEMTTAITVLNTIFYVFVFAVFPLLLFGMLVSIYGLVTNLFNTKKRKDEDWNKWQ